MIFLNKNDKEIRHRVKDIEKINRKLLLVENANAIEKLKERKVIINDEIKHLKEKREDYIREYPQNILKFLIQRSGEKQSLTYDDLYRYVPDDIVSADMIDEIVGLLTEKNVKVTVKKNKIKKKQYPIDYERIEYERNVDDQLSELFKGAFEKIDYNNNIDQTSVNDVKIAPPLLPRIADVSPQLANNDNSLILSEVRVEEKRYIDLGQIETIKPTIIEETAADLEDNSIVPSEISKIYGKERFSNRRLSLFAKIAGDRSEEIVIKFLNETLLSQEKDTIRWISKAGETPGWDIAYFDSDNRMVAIEVKGTTGDSFPNVEITANEWSAANELRDRYWIYLVTSCFKNNPKIQRLNNPVLLKESGILRVTPMLWKIEMLSSD
jgi:hypothetical protein